MRLLTVTISTLILSLLAGPVGTCAQDLQPLPYEATVLVDGVNVYSGPGKLHYPTDQLARGTAVEVYRHDPGGWCAIRPIVGSFSMVPEESVEMVTNDVARITQDGVKAWVGTRLGNVDEPMWQVRLNKGEQVEILGQLDSATPGGESVNWYQISPPSGEFRWVQISDIEYTKGMNQGPADVLNSAAGNFQGQGTFGSSRINSVIESADFWKNQTQTVGNAPQSSGTQRRMNSRPGSVQKLRGSNSGWRRASQPMRAANHSSTPDLSSAGPSTTFQTPANNTGQSVKSPVGSDSFSAGLPERYADSRFADVKTLPVMPSLDGTGRRGTNLAADSKTPMMATIGDLSQRLTGLELALTLEMLNPPASWQLLPLIQQTQLVYQGSQDPNERSQAERLLNKLQNCQQLKSKMEGSGSQPVSSPRSTTPIGSGVDLKVRMGTTYDAYGWLDKLVRDSGKSPSTFVIKDDSGKITHHVSPAPGLNLHRYLRQKVGVIGQRGYHQQLRLDHVTIERVVVLQKSP